MKKNYRKYFHQLSLRWKYEFVTQFTEISYFCGNYQTMHEGESGESSEIWGESGESI